MDKYDIATIKLSFKNYPKNDKGNFEIYNQDCKLTEIKYPILALQVISGITNENVYEKALSIVNRMMYYNKAMLGIDISKISIEVLDY